MRRLTVLVIYYRYKEEPPSLQSEEVIYYSYEEEAVLVIYYRYEENCRVDKILEKC